MNNGRVPILLYHALFEKEDSDKRGSLDELIYSIPVSEFEEQMEYLKNAGYTSMLLADYLEAVEGRFEMPQRPVLITFDDGDASAVTEALPLLQKYGLKAEFFLVTERVGTEGYVSWEGVQRLLDGGCSVQSHTRTHPFLSDLSVDELRRELCESRKTLVERTGRQIDFLALPGGRSSRRTRAVARECGYRAICTSIFGFEQGKPDLFRLKRIGLKRGLDLPTFSLLLQFNQMTYIIYKLRSVVMDVLKKVLGNGAYVIVRKWLLQKKYAD